MAADVAAALFDVDGTLVDTAYLHTLAWQQALRQYGHQVDAARIHRAIGMGSDQLLDHLLGNGNGDGADGSGGGSAGDRDRSDDEAMGAAHLALYAQHWPGLRAFPGAADLLRECAARGWRVVLSTSASGAELDVLRAALDAEDALYGVTDADAVRASKPAPDLVHSALDKAGAPADHAVFVGDSVWDVRAANRAGTPCVAVESGGFAADELRTAGAVEVHASVRALLYGLDDSVLSRPRAGSR
ncbi:HAD family hydrolase [Streptomyces sp. TLI_171]|uniref:HAD family hydrolase n=1 Tax=Streptomyces sp. TLI_171 TaxID=1938859 RepID=UPI000C1A0FD9|nr:HAD family hydrolase [Streptomyces sp. TLI_171]RKE17488.1 HAD superfamily hydrolase (TIGR01509 family)/HAD superfamily hydrolase (TIGR01549 family) [Streptomyces sp. TLI_171]